jgi:thymidylate synthase
MVLPPCHYGFQVYTRELSEKERLDLYFKLNPEFRLVHEDMNEHINKHNIPTRAISLMWNQRSVDTFLGLPFNIASYGLLLEIIAKEVNMVPDDLIGNLGDCHLYLNHVDQAKEQIGRKLTIEERVALIPEGILSQETIDFFNKTKNPNDEILSSLAGHNIQPNLSTREPFELPALKIESEVKWKEGDCLPTYSINDLIIENYQSHPSIKAPLSN